MPIKISTTINSPRAEHVLRKIEQHKPKTCLGAAVRSETRKTLCTGYRLETAEEFEQYLVDHGALLRECG